MTKPRRQITQEERRPRIIRPSALPLGDRAVRERLSVHRLRKSIKAAPLYARLRTVRTAIIAAADAARADRRRIEAAPVPTVGHAPASLRVRPAHAASAASVQVTRAVESRSLAVAVGRPKAAVGGRKSRG